MCCCFSYRVYCLIGDGESAEGSIWEALAFSSKYQLDNLVAIFDVNRLGQSDPTALQHDLDAYKRRLDAFGSVCDAIGSVWGSPLPGFASVYPQMR